MMTGLSYFSRATTMGTKSLFPPPPAVTKTRKITRKPYATLSNTNKNTDIRRMITYLV